MNADIVSPNMLREPLAKVQRTHAEIFHRYRLEGHDIDMLGAKVIMNRCSSPLSSFVTPSEALQALSPCVLTRLAQ